MSELDVDDFRFWIELNDRQNQNYLARAMSGGYTICIPPDEACPDDVTNAFLCNHILVPSRLFTGAYTVLGCDEKEVFVVGALEDMLSTSGAGWEGEATEPHVTIVQQDNIGVSGGECAKIFFLDQALCGGIHVSQSAQQKKNGRTLEEIVEYLNSMDLAGHLLPSLDADIHQFKNGYVLMPGFEKQLEAKLNGIIAHHTDRFIQCALPITKNERRLRNQAALSVHAYVMASVYKKVYTYLARSAENTDADTLLLEVYSQLKHKTREDFDVQLSLCALPVDGMVDALACLRGLVGLTNPYEKLCCIRRAFSALTGVVPPDERKDLTADTLLPLLTYLLVQVAVPNLNTEISFCSSFIPEPCASSELAYTLTSLQVAVGALIENGRALPRTEASKRRCVFPSRCEADGDDEDDDNVYQPGQIPRRPSSVILRPSATASPSSPLTPKSDVPSSGVGTPQRSPGPSIRMARPRVISVAEKKPATSFLRTLLGKD